MSRIAIALALVAAISGCRQLLGIDPASGVPEDGARDSPPPDAGACVDLSVTCANDSTLRTCVAVGELPIDTTCDLACTELDGAHCAQISPAGGAVTTADLDPVVLAGLADATITGSINTQNGTGGGIGADFKVVGGVGVFRFNTLRITGALTVTGTNAIALVANHIIVDGVIDLRGLCTNTNPGPGGFAGGNDNNTGAGLGGGGRSMGNIQGGGGGGHGGVGGAAGTTGGAGPAGGTANGDLTITTLVGGSGGGGGNGGGNPGGGGGGAIQLVSTSTIEINAVGGINAGGCGAESDGCASCTHGGGGAGGTILLEAVSITINGRLAVNGGGGGGAGSSGVDGTLDRVRAQGGGTGNGGPGGRGGAAGTTNGEDAPISGQRPGGGGGAAGRIRVNTKTGTATVDDTSILSPAFDDPGTTATSGIVTVE